MEKRGFLVLFALILIGISIAGTVANLEAQPQSRYMQCQYMQSNTQNISCPHLQSDAQNLQCPYFQSNEQICPHLQSNQQNLQCPHLTPQQTQ